MGINRLVHKGDIKEKGIKDYRREQKWGKYPVVKNEEAGIKGVRYKNEKRKGSERIKKKDLDQNVCQAL